VVVVVAVAVVTISVTQFLFNWSTFSELIQSEPRVPKENP